MSTILYYISECHTEYTTKVLSLMLPGGYIMYIPYMEYIYIPLLPYMEVMLFIVLGVILFIVLGIKVCNHILL